METVVYDDRQAFLNKRQDEIKQISNNADLQKLTKSWFIEATHHRYSYHFDWLGLPIIQFPQDIVAIQEVIWKTNPDLIIETGVARGGSLILSASILQLLNGKGRVFGIDIDIRSHNRQAIESHPLSHRIKMFQGSSIDPIIVSQVKSMIDPMDKVMVILDSNHTHEHVLEELKLYSPLVSKDSYLIVMDTIIEDLPNSMYPDRPWNKTNNPKTAAREFLKENDRFEIDYEIQNKLLITVAPEGYLKCIKK